MSDPDATAPAHGARHPNRVIVSGSLIETQDPARWSTAVGLAAFARSMLEGTQVDLREIGHFGHDTFAHFMRALAVAWPDPPASIQELRQQGWREISREEFRRRTASNDPGDDPQAAA